MELEQQRLDDELRLAEAAVTSLVPEAAEETVTESPGLNRSITAGPLLHRGKCARCELGCYASKRKRKKCAHRRRNRKRNRRRRRRKGKGRKARRRSGGRRRKNRRYLKKKWAYKHFHR